MQMRDMTAICPMETVVSIPPNPTSTLVDAARTKIIESATLSSLVVFEIDDVPPYTDTSALGRGDPNPSRDRNRDDRDRLPEVKSELERTGKRTGREQETSSKAEAPAGISYPSLAALHCTIVGPTDQGDDIEEGEDADQMDGLDEVDENIAAMMGFSGFGSTKVISTLCFSKVITVIVGQGG